MATRTEAPQSTTVWTEKPHLAARFFKTLPKSNCLVDNPFAVCMSVSLPHKDHQVQYSVKAKLLQSFKHSRFLSSVLATYLITTSSTHNGLLE